MKKKLLCLVLIVGVILSLSLSVSAKKFDDTLGHWAEEAIDEWKEYGIVNGIGNNMFNPNGYMTRAEAAAVFSRLLVLNDRASVESFKDVDLNAWYVESLEKCVSAGILNGDGNNMNPGGYITREMFFTMFCRAFNIQPEVSLNKEFSDVDEISTWAEGYTYALINQGYVNGMTADTIAPKTNINRASVIALLDRLIVNYAVQDGYVLNSTNTGLSLVVADNCTVADGFSGIVVLSGEDTTISFEGSSVDTTIIVKADNIVITDVPENVSVTVVKGIENTEVNGKLVEDDNTFTVTIEKVDDSENGEDDKDDENKKPIIIIGGHTHNYIGAETIKASCTADGVMTYKCRCGRSYTETIPKLSETGEHVPAAAVRENEVAGTCKVAGTYDEVVYCSVCGTHEISRTQKTGELGDHTPKAPIVENEVVGNCQTAATYDEVVYCDLCDHEISRTQKTGELGDHEYVSGSCKHCGDLEATDMPKLVVSNATINKNDSTVIVTLSIVENPGISSLKMFVEYDAALTLKNVSFTQLFGPYVAAPAPYTNPQVINMMSPLNDITSSGEFATLTFNVSDEINAGDILNIALSYDDSNTFNGNFIPVEFGIVNGKVTVKGTQHTHTPGTPVVENEVAGNCQTVATYDEVVYCSECDEEISRTQKTGDFGDHEYVSGSCKHCGDLESTDTPKLVVSNATINKNDSTVIVTLSIVENPGISSLKMALEYDTELTLENVAFTQLFGPYVAAPTPYSNPQVINMMSPMSDVTGSGDFATITFKISGEIQSGDNFEIKLTYDKDNTFNGNFTPVEFRIVNGKVTVE